MRKLLLLFLTLLLSLFIASAALADEPEIVLEPEVIDLMHEPEVVYYGNARSGSVGDGHHGCSWYADGVYAGTEATKMVFHPIIENGSRRVFYDSEGKAHYYRVPGYRYAGWNDVRYWDYDGDGQWHFYKDAKGVLHYFYIDPDREGEWHRYTDENGITQYYYEYK
ncbi:MAG: hypothetical protein K6T65_12490 [Peptococcaceae bacterium]|nr:hypothetical protein [Peptococcaceae bacterium]